jgi:hypothetical protein
MTTEELQGLEGFCRTCGLPEGMCVCSIPTGPAIIIRRKDTRFIAPKMRSGIELITAERQRQAEEENWTIEHDDLQRNGELAQAAAVYAFSPVFRWYWPWEESSYKPKTRIRDLVRAGALIAAEIDRLQRLGLTPENDEPTE